MANTIESLTREVYDCTRCVNTGLPFAHCANAGRTYRFPPTIGAMGSVPLLFIGINPRVSDSNRDLHEALMRDYSTFVQLSRNQFEGQAYIGCPGLEGHYQTHVNISRQIFPGTRFEEVAAVTELFLCGSESSNRLKCNSSPCADAFLGRVLDVVSPKVVFAVGDKVKEYLERRFKISYRNPYIALSEKIPALVIAIPHPNAWGEKYSRYETAIREAKEFLSPDEHVPDGGVTSHKPLSIAPKEDPIGSPLKPVGSLQPMNEHIQGDASRCAVEYRHSRLCFKAEFIEPLGMSERFCIVSNVGTFVMSKREFCEVFPNVIQSASYRLGRREYHYTTPPQKSLRFRLKG